MFPSRMPRRWSPSCNKLHLAIALLALALLLQHGRCARCGANAPAVRQTQVGFGRPPEFAVEIRNTCPMCPIIDVHLGCGGFPPGLVDPRLFRVVGDGDCVVNGGLPLAPLQRVAFNYTHGRFPMAPKSWYFQCE